VSKVGRDNLGVFFFARTGYNEQKEREEMFDGDEDGIEDEIVKRVMVKKKKKRGK
jgi:hypothetical protein